MNFAQALLMFIILGFIAGLIISIAKDLISIAKDLSRIANSLELINDRERSRSNGITCR